MRSRGGGYFLNSKFPCMLFYSSMLMYTQLLGFDCMVCGDTKVRRINPGCNFFMSICGNTYIDIRDSHFAPGTKVKIFTLRLCGDARILVPRGTQVVVRRFLLCGNRDIHVDRATEDSAEPLPRISITIISLCGDAQVSSDDSEN
jgi:hypothetical protein